VLVIMGGSQGALALNRLVRQCAEAWLEAGIWMVHLTGDRDPDVGTLQHPHYIERPFFSNMAGLLQRANFALSRSGAGTLTELAITGTPSILIPYPYAAEDHQYFNAKVFIDGGAAYGYREPELTAEGLTALVLELLRSPEKLLSMAESARQLAVPDSNVQCAQLVQKQLQRQ
jgi:UDP-N-acetylglucosamine--N-acetylmuramyl-(pentapeptide) pyrophosphoryl-undecaprenol N-acetylglucosamine transferase